MKTIDIVIEEEINSKLDKPNFSRFTQHERKTHYQENRIRHADEILNTTPIGDRVVFEGSCPSGSTYDGYCTWDGTDETRLKILRAAAKHAVFQAGDGWLVREKDVSQGIWAAKLRTG